ncbi:GNAT family N-acetyltransferase [Salinimonas lutimaris]|uniref:GNAT family N-acetyltransferase n=1 Tax=Salinimonas lutimaris TaxID=914153 RepID=UPI0010C11351|nr:GNAT family N-acetyltransferase [Salinimonas lutimaris]
MKIIRDDLSGDTIARFLQQHIQDMQSVSPPESKHALDLDGLRQPDIQFWSVWLEDDLVGCCAIKQLTRTHGEIKSMRVAQQARNKGVATFMLQHLIKHADSCGLSRLSLETGTMDFFAPARRLYEKSGFVSCPPFAQYQCDPNSCFYTLTLA